MEPTRLLPIIALLSLDRAGYSTGTQWLAGVLLLAGILAQSGGFFVHPPMICASNGVTFTRPSRFRSSRASRAVGELVRPPIQHQHRLVDLRWDVLTGLDRSRDSGLELRAEPVNHLHRPTLAVPLVGHAEASPSHEGRKSTSLGYSGRTPRPGSSARDRSRLLAHATSRREQSDQRLAEATSRCEHARDLVALLEHGPARWLRRGDLAKAREQAKQAEASYQVAQQQADRAADRERDARHQQQHYQAHQEANPDVREHHRELLRVQAWRKRADARAVELLRPEWSRGLGERPATVKGGRVWDRVVEQTVEYRQRWDVEDAEHPLRVEPHGTDVSFAQRRAWRHATRAVGRLRELAGDRAGRGDQRETTSRGDHRDDHEQATGRGDHRGERRRPLDRERDHDRERAM